MSTALFQVSAIVLIVDLKLKLKVGKHSLAMWLNKKTQEVAFYCMLRFVHAFIVATSSTFVGSLVHLYDSVVTRYNFATSLSTDQCLEEIMLALNSYSPHCTTMFRWLKDV